ncbi:hypothetical protein D018_3569B, partial [Vibrio parahaemolyticus VP2007-007]
LNIKSKASLVNVALLW